LSKKTTSSAGEFMTADSLSPKTESRRRFLRSSAAVTVAAVSYPALAAARSSERAAAIYSRNPSVADFELDEITIDSLQKAFTSGQYSARSVTEKYLARMQEIDKAGPMLNAVIETNPDALKIADALDQERKSKGARGSLHGIPVLIKDNIDTGDHMYALGPFHQRLERTRRANSQSLCA
jgi:amidase